MHPARTLLLLPAATATLALAAAAAAPRPADFDRLVSRLGDGDYHSREAAGRALRAAGSAALPPVRRAAAGHPDPEVRRRAADLVPLLEMHAVLAIQNLGGRVTTGRRASERWSASLTAASPSGTTAWPRCASTPRACAS